MNYIMIPFFLSSRGKFRPGILTEAPVHFLAALGHLAARYKVTSQYVL